MRGSAEPGPREFGMMLVEMNRRLLTLETLFRSGPSSTSGGGSNLPTIFTGGNEATVDSETGLIQIGASDAPNIGIDGNEIQARNGSGAAANLTFNPHGGDVTIGGNITLTGIFYANGRYFVFADGQYFVSTPWWLVFNGAGKDVYFDGSGFNFRSAAGALFASINAAGMIVNGGATVNGPLVGPGAAWRLVNSGNSAVVASPGEIVSDAVAHVWRSAASIERARIDSVGRFVVGPNGAPGGEFGAYVRRDIHGTANADVKNQVLVLANHATSPNNWLELPTCGIGFNATDVQGNVSGLILQLGRYGRLEVRNGANNWFASIAASSFENQSTIESKTGVAPMRGALAAIRGLDVVTYEPKVRSLVGVPSERFAAVNERWQSRGRSRLTAPARHVQYVEHPAECSIDVCGATPDAPCAAGKRHATPMISVVAESVDEHLAEIATYENGGAVAGWDVAGMASVAIAGVKELDVELRQAKERIAELESVVADLVARLS